MGKWISKEQREISLLRPHPNGISFWKLNRLATFFVWSLFWTKKKAYSIKYNFNGTVWNFFVLESLRLECFLKRKFDVIFGWFLGIQDKKIALILSVKKNAVKSEDKIHCNSWLLIPLYPF